MPGSRETPGSLSKISEGSNVFEVNGNYANRIGKYTVLKIDGSHMVVRYVDGNEATLNVAIQERIWENIVAEQESQRPSRRSSNSAGRQISFVIKTVSISGDDNLSIPGLLQRIAAVPMDVNLQPDDRLVYFALEPNVFFAVATVTGKPREASAKEFLFGDGDAHIHIYPIDVDAHITDVKLAIPVDSVELESLPNYRMRLRQPNAFLPINEDDFELLSELITEIHEEADVEDELEEELIDEEEEE